MERQQNKRDGPVRSIGYARNDQQRSIGRAPPQSPRWCMGLYMEELLLDVYGLYHLAKIRWRKKVKVWTLAIAPRMSQTRDQQHFTISEVAADWHEPMVPQPLCGHPLPTLMDTLDPWCS